MDEADALGSSTAPIAPGQFSLDETDIVDASISEIRPSEIPPPDNDERVASRDPQRDKAVSATDGVAVNLLKLAWDFGPRELIGCGLAVLSRRRRCEGHCCEYEMEQLSALLCRTGSNYNTPERRKLLNRTLFGLEPMQTLGWIAHVGRYELDETFCFIVTARRERLFAELTGQGHFELFAEREVDAFATVAFQTTFNADAGGRIDRAVIHITHFDLVMVRMSFPWLTSKVRSRLPPRRGRQWHQLLHPG